VTEHARAEREPEEVAPPTAQAAPAPTLHGLVTRLQRTAGNRAVVRLLAREAAAPAAATLDQADIDALMAYRQVHELAVAGADAATSAPAKRAAIVKLALSQVGKVRDEDRGDGKKVGAERLKEFYRVACPSYHSGYDYGIERVGMWAAQTAKDKTKKGKPWSWCAIFGVWAIRQITGIGSFAGEPIGLGKVNFFTGKGDRDGAAVKPGDLICRKEQHAIEKREKPPDVDNLNHQCLVASVDTTDPAQPRVTTVNGNGPYQSIYVRTEPLSWYWGYYDSLSETDVEAFEGRLKKRFGHA
jgi:hypothetical protein